MMRCLKRFNACFALSENGSEGLKDGVLKVEGLKVKISNPLVPRALRFGIESPFPEFPTLPLLAPGPI
jgi:hypothetical protein